MGENNAVEMLLDKINNLTRRLEILEERATPTYSSCTTSIPIVAAGGNYGELGPAPTITSSISNRATIYGPSIADRYETRLNDIQNQLDEINNTHREIREDGNLYITT